MRTALLALTTTTLLGSFALVGCKDKDAAQSTSTTGASTAATPAAAAPAAAAAKKGLKPGETTLAACNTIAKDGECGEALGDAAMKAKASEAIKSLCSSGTFAESCPAADIVGACRMGKDMISYYYAKGGKTYDAASAKAACEKGHGRAVE